MMKKPEQIGLDFEIDKLTHSIENVITGDNFATDIIIVNSLFKEDTKVMFPFSLSHNLSSII